MGAPLSTEANLSLGISHGPSARTEQNLQLSGDVTALFKLAREMFPEFIWILHLSVIDNLAITMQWFSLLWRN